MVHLSFELLEQCFMKLMSFVCFPLTAHETEEYILEATPKDAERVHCAPGV
jgi:hypothetical protein